MPAFVCIGIQIHRGAVGHLRACARVLVGDHRARLAGVALSQLVLEALDVQRDLRIAPLVADEVGHLDDGAAAVGAVGGDAKVGRDLTDDVADDGRSQNGRVVRFGVVGVVEHDVDEDLRVVGGQDRHKGSDLLVVAVAAAVHVQLLGRAGLAADAVACHIGAAAAALGAVRHFIFHDLADGLAGALADDLAADVCPHLFDDVAVLVGDLIHHMRGDEIAAVDSSGDGRADLQRRDRHGLTEGRRGQLDFAQAAFAVILHEVRLAGQVHTGALGEAEGVEVIIEQAGTDALAQLDEVDVAAVPQRFGQILDAVGLFAGAVIGLLGDAVGTGTVQRGVEGRLAGVHPHGRRDDLEDASGVVQLGDGLILPLDVAVIAGIIALRVQHLVAVRIRDIAAVLILEVDAVEFRFGVDQLVEIGLVGGVIQRVIGVEVRLGGHGQDGTGLDVHHDGRAAVLDVVGRDGLVQVALRHLLDVHIQRQHQIGAVLGSIGGGVFVRDGIAVSVAQGDGAAIDARQRGFVGFFQAVGAVAVGIAEAQHRRRKGSVGVIPLEALGGRDRDAALADALVGIGLFVGLVIRGDVLFNGQLDGVVHLGGQRLVGRVALGQSIVHRLILGLVGRRGGIHAVQALAIAGEQPQGDLGADLLQCGRVGRPGHLAGVVVLAAGEQGRAVAGVGPDGPDHAGGGQRDAGRVVDLAAGRLNGAVQQLLLGRILAEGRTVLDLDVVQAVDDDACRRHDEHHRRAKAEMPQPCAQPLVRVGAAQPVKPFFVLGGWFLHVGLTPEKPKKRALPHAFPVLF